MKAKLIRLSVYPFFLVVLVGKDKCDIKLSLNRLGIPITTEQVNEFVTDTQDRAFASKLD